MPKQTRKQAELENRRNSVAEAYLRGNTQQQIAAALGVSQATISKDVNFLLRAWREQREATIEDAVTLQIEELRRVRREAWRKYGKSEEYKWLDMVINIQKREATLLGLDAPKRSEITGAGGNELIVKVIYEDNLPNA